MILFPFSVVYRIERLKHDGGFMKKIGLLLVITCLVIGTVFAQNQERERRSPPESITVEGTLQLQNGMIAVKSGENVYYVPMLQRLVGFVEGLKEGNTVTIEGYAGKNFLRPTKLTLSGKSYDFPAMGNAGFAQRAPGSGKEARPEGRKGKTSNPRQIRPQPKFRKGACPGCTFTPRRQIQRPPARRPDPRQQKS